MMDDGTWFRTQIFSEAEPTVLLSQIVTLSMDEYNSARQYTISAVPRGHM